MQASTQSIHFDGPIKELREKVHGSTIQPVTDRKRLHGDSIQKRGTIQSNILKRVEVRSK